MTIESAYEEALTEWLSGKSTTPEKGIAHSTDVREDLFTELRDAVTRVPYSLRAELLEVLERTALLVAMGSGPHGEVLQGSDERREREEIERRERALAEIADRTGSAADQDNDKARKPPARAATKKR